MPGAPRLMAVTTVVVSPGSGSTKLARPVEVVGVVVGVVDYPNKPVDQKKNSDDCGWSVEILSSQWE